MTGLDFSSGKSGMVSVEKVLVGTFFNVLARYYGSSTDPITFPTPSRCATCYATDAGFDIKELSHFYETAIS